MTTQNPRKRSTAFKVQLTPQIHADLIAVAEAIGQTPATLASFAIGYWVAQQKRNLTAGEMAVNAMVDKLGPDMAKQLSLLTGSAK